MIIPASKHEYALAYWCSLKGIKKADLDRHPSIDDVILLMRWRDAMWQSVNNSEQAFWGALWNIVYRNGGKLKKKHLDKLEFITNNIILRQEKKAQKLQTQRERIKQLRQPV